MLIVLTALILRIAPARIAASYFCQSVEHTGWLSALRPIRMCWAYVAQGFLSPLLQQPLAVSRLLRWHTAPLLSAIHHLHMGSALLYYQIH